MTTPQTDHALRRDSAALGGIGRACVVGLPEARSDGFFQLDINSLLNPAGSQAHEVGFGVAGRNLGEFNAPAVHDFDLGGRGESSASCCANSFNSIWRPDSAGASARHVLKGARFSRRMNFIHSGLPSWCENYFLGRDAPEIHPRQTVDFRRLLFLWRADRIGTPRSQETQTRKIRLAIRWPLRQPTLFQIGI